ncbi:MAG: HAMP domain-containing histidine kinase [Bacteriovoracaceae bacterium]|nr:HAMP domain-containing histidine kinase [Bacteriovoracaceae bacterium]
MTCTTLGLVFFNLTIDGFSGLLIQKVEVKNQEKFQSMVNVLRNDLLLDDTRTVKNKLDSWLENKQISGFQVLKKNDLVINSKPDYTKMKVYSFDVLYSENTKWGKVALFDFKIDSKSVKESILSQYLILFILFVLILSTSIYKLISFILSEINPLIDNFLNRHEQKSHVSKGIRRNIFRPLIQTLNNASLKIQDYEEEQIKYEAEKAQLELGRKVAHDIRSPLEALKVASGEMESNPLFDMAIDRIENIANDLLDETRLKEIGKKDSISKIIKSVITEKELIWKDEVQFSFENKDNLDFDIDVEFQRVLSNLINNSREAKKDKVIQIELKLNLTEDQILLKIKDNGAGMSPELVSKIMNESVSFGKHEGNAIGVSSARHFFETINGSITYESTEGEGTTVFLKFPKGLI